MSLEDALRDLTHLNTRIREHDGLLLSEGLPDERVPLAGLSVDDAASKLQQATASIRSEKNALVQEALNIRRREQDSGRAAIDHTANGRPMALAKGGNPKQMAK